MHSGNEKMADPNIWWLAIFDHNLTYILLSQVINDSDFLRYLQHIEGFESIKNL
jgi:hypothetical protein